MAITHTVMGQPDEVTIIRREANFDRACDEAARDVRRAVKDGTESVAIRFVSYSHVISVGGDEHVYVFSVAAQQPEEAA